MNATLTVEDPLADQEVSIVITLAASDLPRDERPAMISVGVANELPAIKSGLFGNVSTLIAEAWTAFGVQAQLAAVAAQREEQEMETAPTQVVAEEPLAATDNTDDEPIPAPALRPTVAKPPASNLSLF